MGKAGVTERGTMSHCQNMPSLEMSRKQLVGEGAERRGDERDLTAYERTKGDD